MKVMMIGDTHCGVRHLEYKMKFAQAQGIVHLLVVGDFGLFPKSPSGTQFLDRVNELAVHHNVIVYAIPGNHEDHDAWEYIVANWPDSDGLGRVRGKIRLIPKVHRWSWGGKTFLAAGGAVSIDKEMRLEDEAKYGGPRTQWWPNEVLSQDDIALAKALGRNREIDYLITHDCSDWSPHPFNLVPDPDSRMHRKVIDDIIDTVRPRFQFHGHMHARYDWFNTGNTGMFGTEPEFATRTIGLTCNNANNSYGILTLDDNAKEEWKWQ